VVVGIEWDSRMKAMIERLKKMEPASEPFRLGPEATVVDPAKFHAALQGDALIGPRAPRAKTGAFQVDLERYLAIRGEQWDTKSVKSATAGA
jgi:hypothetical protein